jgi:diguanylate cyclase (GGDEF)-like protein
MSDSNSRHPEILIVDNSKTFSAIASRRMERELGMGVHTLHSYGEAEQYLTAGHRNFFVALVGLYMKDAHSGATVNLMLSHQIPTIVITGKFSEDLRDEFISKKVVDYVLKENVHSLDYIIALIQRLRRNQHIKALVVDDSRTVCDAIASLLRVHLYQVYEARDARQALELLDKHQDIKLVITDHGLPDMDGAHLTRKIREQYNKERMAIIGLSGRGGSKMSAQFIKNGANDFLSKSFLVEEFYCRVSQNMEMLEVIEASKDMSNRDYLTGLYNRRYLYEMGKKLHASSQRRHITLAVAMVDVDHFKYINDTYGHDAGDKVLQRLAQVVNDWFRESDLVARFGGEEFCIVTTNMNQDFFFSIFDGLREEVSKLTIDVGGQILRITISIGVCARLQDSLEQMINEADALLYQAKNRGRNRVVIHGHSARSGA